MTLCLLFTLPTQAATWQWSSRSGREQLDVRLDDGMEVQATARTGPTSLDIRLNTAAGGVTGREAPAPGSLIERVESVGDSLRLILREAAFGYIVQRGAGSVSVEVFADPIGERWQPSDARVLPPLPSPPSVVAPVTTPVTITPGSPEAPGGVSGDGAGDRSGDAPAGQAAVPAVQASRPQGAPEQPVSTPPVQATAQPPQVSQNQPPSATPVAPTVPASSQTTVQTVAAEQAEAPRAASPPPSQAGAPAAQTPPVRAVQTPVQTPVPAPDAADGGRVVVAQGGAQPPAETGLNVTVNVNATPAGMPGAGPTVSENSPIAVPSGSSLPVRADRPDAATPSATILDAITRRIESLPAQVADVQGGATPLAGALISTPAAPAPPPGENPPQPAPTASAPSVQTDQGSLAQPPTAGAPQPGPQPGIDVIVSPQTRTSRLVSEDGDSLRARFNTGGPDGWPDADGLSTFVDPAGSGEADKVTGAIQAPAPAEDKPADTQAEPEVIYVDEQGNPVPKPVDVNAVLAEARELIQSLQFGPAQERLLQLKTVPMPPEKREEMLYLLSDAVTGLYNGKWMEGYEPIVASTSEAMNANLRSPQVARALERLGMINLRTGNQQDAAGYFGVLRNKFPMDPQVAECYHALGMDQLERGQYAEAVQSFQLVMQEYPESQAVRKAARFMAEALYKQGHYERAMTIVDFVDRRWPRIYIEDPAYLLMVADTQFRRGRLGDALQTYWTYYNLVPSAPNNDQLLLNVGTIYLMQGDMDLARTMYAELLKTYPESPYAPLAVLRQGEEGIFEGNLSIDDLFALFNRPNLSTLPEVAYHRLLQDHPQSDEAVTAALRLAAWRLWNKDYADAMDQAEAFVGAHPDSLYTPRADEIILRAFAVELAMDLAEENYERILQRWERFPQIRGAYTPPGDDLRVALARAHLNRGNEQEGFALLQPFLERPQDPKHGDYVYKLNLARALRTEDWQGILDLGDKVENWNLPVDERNQLVYAMAIARENLGQGQEAVPLWTRLYQRDDIPLYQKAYATYFMARDAERRRSIEDAYQLNRDTLDLFTRLGVESPDRADPARIRESLVALMDVTEVANRFAEALEWADQYAPFAPESSPDYAAYRFRLSRLHRKMGDLARWEYLLEDLVAREPDSVFGRMAASELRTYAVARDLSRFQPSGSSSSESAP